VDQANIDDTRAGAVKGRCPQRTCKVGSYKPNAFGLHDMHGNVYEWCADWYGKDYYTKSPPRDPLGPSGGEDRMVRSGSWRRESPEAQSAFRDYRPPASRYNDIGFRVALVPSGE
jgi:formylglycine-generating enzyme required for sulfatase activity